MSWSQIKHELIKFSDIVRRLNLGNGLVINALGIEPEIRIVLFVRFVWRALQHNEYRHQTQLSEGLSR